MKILIVTVYYLPTHKASGKLIHDLGIEFRNQGHEVTILAPTPNIKKNCEACTEEGLRIIRVKAKRIDGVAKPLRAVRENRLSGLLWRRAHKILIEKPADLIVFYSPTIFFGALVQRLKSLWRCPAYLILRDIFPQWAVDAGILQRGLIYRLFRQKEIEQYEAADVIAVQSPGDLRYFETNFPNKRYKTEVLYNWNPLQEDNLPTTSYRSELGLEEKIVFVYGGNLGVAQDVDNIIRLAAGFVGHPKVSFLLVGFGSEVSRIRATIADKKLHNLQVIPSMDQPRYLAMLAEFDVGLISLDRRLTTHNIPGKLLGYMYWGLPILASINPGNDLFELLRVSGAGVCVTNGEDEKLHDATLRLATDPELRARLGRNARTLLETTFSVRVAAQQITASLHLKSSNNPSQPQLSEKA